MPISFDDVEHVFDEACVQKLAKLAGLPSCADLTTFGSARGRIQRFARHERLIARLAELLADDGCHDIWSRCRWLAALLERVGARAAMVWSYQRKNPHRKAEQRQKQQRVEEATIRTHLVMNSLERYNKKLGKTKATRRAVRHWERRLLATDRIGIRVRPPRPSRWEEVVADALIETLESKLGRPLLNPRTKAAEKEIVVLVEAFALVERVAGAPALFRGKRVRKPGTANWFRSRVATRRRRQKSSILFGCVEVECKVPISAQEAGVADDERT